MNAPQLPNLPGFSPVSAPEAIRKGGSDRSFFRFSDASFGPCVLCLYSARKRENFLYADIARFLASCGVPVPKIFFHDPERRILVMEDAGGEDLLDFSKSAAEGEAASAYKAALLAAAALHSGATAEFSKRGPELMPGFDAELYAWEQSYFFENLIEKRLGMKAERPEAEWEGLARFLAAAPQALLHRDLQSQNVIVCGPGKVKFIDFQGMRTGPFWYDVGSLLFDPYAGLSPAARAELFAYYCGLRGLDPDACTPAFLAASAERLMQALGAYAFLADSCGKAEYLAHIPPALASLAECAEAAGLEGTRALAAAAQKRLAGNPELSIS